MKNLSTFTVLGIACLLYSGCKTPSVNLATNEPIKVDINMRLDVYQHDPTPKTAAKTQAPPAPPALTAEARRRNRMADVQAAKNSRLVGENKEGLLFIREQVVGKYGDFVNDMVRAENADRMEEMKKMSDDQKIPLADIQKKQAELWRNLAFKDEWIEAPKEDGSYQWIQKE